MPDDLVAYLGIVAGVIISVVLPPLTRFVFRGFGVKQGSINLLLWGGLLAFGGLTGVLALAVYRSNHPHDSIPLLTAILVGYGWESSIHRFFQQ